MPSSQSATVHSWNYKGSTELFWEHKVLSGLVDNEELNNEMTLSLSLCQRCLNPVFERLCPGRLMPGSHCTISAISKERCAIVGKISHWIIYWRNYPVTWPIDSYKEPFKSIFSWTMWRYASKRWDSLCLNNLCQLTNQWEHIMKVYTSAICSSLATTAPNTMQKGE